jgi:hypothetical protein
MNVKNDILEELRSLSEFVATISRDTPYRVADDYFTDLSDRVLFRIKTQHKQLVFNVPDGYFEGFAEGLLARIKAGAGARPEFEPLKTLPETLDPASVDQELGALSPLLAQLRFKETYRMPDGYFEEISPVLTVARELNPYTVPEEYFHQLPAEIEERLVEPEEVKKPAKLVAFGSRRTNWWKYSAAAVVAGLIFTIGWLRLSVTGGGHPRETVNIPAGLPKVSDQELQSFLADQDTTLAQPTNNTATLDFNDNDVKSLLGDIPEGELKQYMEEHGGPNDIATN